MARVKHWTVRCARRCKNFAIRAGVITVALLAVFLVAINAGEVIPVSLAIERITEAFGFAAADALAD